MTGYWRLPRLSDEGRLIVATVSFGLGDLLAKDVLVLPLENIFVAKLEHGLRNRNGSPTQGPCKKRVG